MYIYNTGSPVSEFSPINVKQAKALEEIKLFFITFMIIEFWIPSFIICMVSISAYFISEHNILRMTYIMTDLMDVILFLCLDLSYGSIDEILL